MVMQARSFDIFLTNVKEDAQVIWRGLLERGRISEAEFAAAQILNYYRSKDELCAPLREAGAVRDAGLRLESFETMVTACPYRSAWLAGNVPLDEFCKRLVMTMRTWSNSSFECALDGARAPSSAHSNELFDHVRIVITSRLQNSSSGTLPASHAERYGHAVTIVSKLSSRSPASRTAPASRSGAQSSSFDR